MQEENHTISEFSERTDRLAEKLGLPLRDLPQRLDISQSMLFAYRKGTHPISKKAWRKIRSAEIAAGIVSEVSEGEQADYRKSGSSAASAAPAARTRSGGMLNPSHEPTPAQPSQQECIDYFLRYLARAAHEPGGLGVVMYKLKKHLPLDDFEEQKKT